MAKKLKGVIDVVQIINKKVNDISINGNEFPSLQEAVNYAEANNKVLNLAGMSFNLDAPLHISSGVKIVGDVTTTTIDCRSLASGSSIVIGNGTSVNGLVLDGVRFIGNPDITCISITGTINTPTTDSVFRNIRVQNFGIGMTATYAWCNLFENIRFQACTRPLQVGSQFNNNEFSRCSFVTYSQPMVFTNCEGVNMTSPNIANVTGNAMSIRQSNISIINPYYEYVEGYVALLGNSSESVPSSLISLGGKSTDPTVKFGITGANGKLSIKGLNESTKVVVDDGDEAVTPYKSTNHIETDSDQTIDYIRKWDGVTFNPFNPSYGGVNLSYTLSPDMYTKVTHDSATGGLQLGSLVIGEVYTLVYRLRREPSSQVILRLGSLASQQIYVGENTLPFETRYLPFVAKDTTLRLMWSQGTALDIDFIGICKGSSFPKTFSKGAYFTAPTPPSSTTGWSLGTRIAKSNPTVGGSEGWVCVASGDSRIWKPFGKIED